MGDNVWTQLFVQAANFLSSLSASSSVAQNPPNGGAFPSAPANVAATISTSTNATRLELVLNRKETENGGIFGTIQAGDGSRFTCLSLENQALSIPTGRYEIEIYDSPHAGHPLPRLKNVPGRTEIEIHCGNIPQDSKGCIIVGDHRAGGTLEDSRTAFDRLFPLIRAAIATGPQWIEIVGEDIRPC